MLRTLILIMAVSVGALAHASEQLEINSFAQINQKIRAVAAQFGNDNILVAFDTDDTLLVLNQDIGGEAWFEWQTTDEQCENNCTPKMKEPPGANAIAKGFPELLDKLGKILFLSHAHPNESEIPADLKSLQADGIKTVVLTARGFLNRDATQRQYTENGISFSRVGLSADQEGLEYTPQVSAEDMQKFGITSVRPVNYTRGIINTDGQHKGVMLKAWLHQVNVQPKAIVFVDNESRQTNRMFAVFNGSDTDITTIRYSHADANRAAFWASDKQNAIDQWSGFSALIKQIFGE